MNIEYWIYVVADSHGNKDAVVANEPADTVQICGMRSKLGNPVHFESDAYHLEEWCKDEEFSYEAIKMDAEV